MEKENWHREIEWSSRGNIRKTIKTLLRGREEEKSKRQCPALVPILFMKESVDAIDLLIEHRQDMEILPNNEYVFARGEGKNYMIGWDTLQAIAKQIDLKKPKLVTPTPTRKWLATIMQLLDLSNDELTWLANYTGHTKMCTWHGITKKMLQ